MNCEKYSDLIRDFAEKELDAAIANEVSLHVFACPHCETKFENLTRNKEIYLQFLFEVEPPKNLSNRFQARFEKEIPAKSVLPIPQNSFGKRLADLFSRQNYLPLMSAFCVLLIFGFGFLWLKISTSETAKSNDFAISKTTPNLVANNELKEVETIERKEVQSEIAESLTKLPKNIEKVSFEKTKAVESKHEKFTVIRQKNLKNPGAKKLPILSAEDILRIQELQAYQAQKARQMEKIEMLLRSFRNAPFSEVTEQYDVSFEKQQARKLLATTENLRVQAEFYGDFFTKETLSKVEPFLLDIANLENKPSSEMVLDIKQRVGNESLIASVQMF